MKKQLQEDAKRLADEKAQLAARREAELKKREEEVTSSFLFTLLLHKLKI